MRYDILCRLCGVKLGFTDSDTPLTLDPPTPDPNAPPPPVSVEGDRRPNIICPACAASLL